MEEEIVPADQPSSSRRPPRAAPAPAAYAPEPFDSEKLPSTLVSEVRPFLRVANQIESESPRVAYLCRFHAFEKAHIMDPQSSGRGVRQFKTSLLQRLEQDDKATNRRRREKSDARELKSFYNEKLKLNANETVPILFEVLKAVISGAGPEIVAAGEHTKERAPSYGSFNILPLNPGGEKHAIMLLPEIKAAVLAVRNVRGLPLSENREESCAYIDVLDWLQCWFGFQKGNTANQRENLILLLASIHVRQNPKPASMSKLDDRALNELMTKIFGNYMNWCIFLSRKSNIMLPYVKQEVQQYKIIYIALYLLIWGEAANLRLMPECLCYIFHHMAYELYGILSSAVSLNTGVKVLPAYGGGPESFLENVVTPLYRVVQEEARKNKNGTSCHSTWRNYDDLNEFFWGRGCFKLGWPMRLDNDFFYTSSSVDQKVATGETCQQKWLGKTSFVEIRSFWHIFRSFDRMWTFLILALQAIIVMAWHGLETPLTILDPIIFEDIMTIFISDAALRLIQVSLDICFSWKARLTMDFYQKLRFLMKFSVAVIWMIALPASYSASQAYSACSRKQHESNLSLFCLSPYLIAVIIYLMPNAIGVALFLVPAFSSFLETSNWWICNTITWWTQTRLFVGRGMQENLTSLLKYTIFWVILLSGKFAFSYYFEIKPLVEATKQIIKVSVHNYDWHELFPEVKSNGGAILALWAPVILVYFMDTQIWYSIFCTVFGGFYGIAHHLGEIRTMGMVRSRFHTLPSVFNVSLVPPSEKDKERNFKSFLLNKIFKSKEIRGSDLAKFALVWNQIISGFRSEDLISNREMDMMIMPLSSEYNFNTTQWPLFLLAAKFSVALNMAIDFDGTYEQLHRKMKKDSYMFSAVHECYYSLKIIFNILVIGVLEKRVVDAIFEEVEMSTRNATLLSDFKMEALPALQDKFIQVVKILFENKQAHRDRLVILLQDILEILIRDIMVNGSRILDIIDGSQVQERNGILRYEPQLFAPDVANPAVHFPLPTDGPLKKQVKRLFLLLTVKEKAMDIPSNLEARRRISFFATSLFMDIPTAPKVRYMLSFSVLTPYYTEEVKFSEEELHSNQDGASILSYMQKIYPDEWKNFLERVSSKMTNDEIRYWASFRGQTLSRTVRGMMNYRKALKLQGFLDMADNQDILKGHISFERDQSKKNSQQSLSAQLDALVDIKFTYVVSCQEFGSQKCAGDPHAQDIIDLMIKYPSLRVSYVEEKEEIVDGKAHKVYSSILIKADNNLDQEIYRIKLPGPPIIGEGKPENQNHAIIFTRGDALQTIDMNQDNYFEEAIKMRNLLQEFLKHHGEHHPTILGLREHIFTGSVSSLAGFMSYQESSFVTIGQRFLSDPLRVRFHYGHPDLFDRIFHLTRGGISKASKTVNLSEDIFAGFNSTLRGGYVTYNEYMQVGKGRDVGLNQISKFEAKVANGNSEQTLSRDIHRLGRRFDFFRMLSCYFTTIGFYVNSLISVIGVYVYLYGQLYLVLSGLEKALLNEARHLNMESLETALASQSFLQLGLLTGLPMVMELGLEKGIRAAVSDFVLMQLQLASVFFTFSLGTKAHYYGRTILHGGAKYRPTGRKFVVFHASFTENYQLYSRSHFVKGFELLFLLMAYNLVRRGYESSMAYVTITYSIWFMALTWLFAPFLFNPSGFGWRKIVEDWTDWKKWMDNQGGVGVQPEKSWESWWNAEHSHLLHAGLVSRSLEVLLSLRFFIYQYGLVYHLNMSQQSKDIVVYVLSWIVIVTILLLVKVVNVGRQRLSVKYHLAFRFLKLVLFLGAVAGTVTLSRIYTLSARDLMICCVAFVPTGWGLLSVAQALRPKIEEYGVWDSIQVIAQAYDYGMGALVFAPIAILAWMPVISAIQTRVLFNQAFSRQLQIKPLLAGKNKKR